MSTIPARDIVAVNPGVLAAGGSALDMIGLLLTTSTRVPIGAVQPFASASDVGDYFGEGSQEKALADVYFLGFDNSTRKPGSILFAQYPESAVAAWLRGFNTGLSLSELQALAAGTIAVTVSGVLKTSASIDLSAATSFSNAATIIQAAFTSPGFAVTYDSTSGGFVFTNTATGEASTITAATTSALATSLKLTAAAGAVTSQGADAASPGAFMDGVVDVTQDWATFMTLFDPDGGSGNAVKLAFATWVNAQGNEYAYVAWDTDVQPTESQPDVSSLGYLLNQGNFSGTYVRWAPDATEGPKKAAFICGTAASIDFTRLNGRITFAFRSQTGLVADVVNQSVAHNLGGDPQSIGSRGNYYNFYGAYATRNDQFVFENRGFVSGPFLWFDSYVKPDLAQQRAAARAHGAADERELHPVQHAGLRAHRGGVPRPDQRGAQLRRDPRGDHAVAVAGRAGQLGGRARHRRHHPAARVVPADRGRAAAGPGRARLAPLHALVHRRPVRCRPSTSPASKSSKGARQCPSPQRTRSSCWRSPASSPVPQGLQQFSAEDVFTNDPVQANEIAQGIDGKLTSGFVFNPVPWSVSLMADSPSNRFFDTWYQTMVQNVESYRANGSIWLKSLNQKFDLVNGALTTYRNMPDAAKTLRSRAFVITWERISPALIA